MHQIATGGRPRQPDDGADLGFLIGFLGGEARDAEYLLHHRGVENPGALFTLGFSAGTAPHDGGQIALESELGKGSRFWFQLSLRTSGALPEDMAASESLRGLKVLIVEDNPTNAAILQHYTQAWGMQPVCVDRAEKALACLETQSVDLALIDWKLPGMSGPELAKAIETRFGGITDTLTLGFGSGVEPGLVREVVQDLRRIPARFEAHRTGW